MAKIENPDSEIQQLSDEIRRKSRQYVLKKYDEYREHVGNGFTIADCREYIERHWVHDDPFANDLTREEDAVYSKKVQSYKTMLESDKRLESFFKHQGRTS